MCAGSIVAEVREEELGSACGHAKWREHERDSSQATEEKKRQAAPVSAKHTPNSCVARSSRRAMTYVAWSPVTKSPVSVPGVNTAANTRSMILGRALPPPSWDELGTGVSLSRRARSFKGGLSSRARSFKGGFGRNRVHLLLAHGLGQRTLRLVDAGNLEAAPEELAGPPAMSAQWSRRTA
jgi:hypothetical protein